MINPYQSINPCRQIILAICNYRFDKKKGEREKLRERGESSHNHIIQYLNNVYIERARERETLLFTSTSHLLLIASQDSSHHRLIIHHTITQKSYHGIEPLYQLQLYNLINTYIHKCIISYLYIMYYICMYY